MTASLVHGTLRMVPCATFAQHAIGVAQTRVWSAATRGWGAARNRPLMLVSYLPVPVNSGVATVNGLLTAGSSLEGEGKACWNA